MHRRTGPLRIVLSGPIGAGKSTVRDLLADHGCAVIDSDAVGHGVLLPDGAAFDSVASRWPRVVVNGSIDRGRLAEIVFSDEDELRHLECMTHPAIRREIERRIAELGDRDVVVELPLVESMFGDGDWHRLVVLADDAARMERLLIRGMDRTDAARRMAAQAPLDVWEAGADSVIWNNDDRATLATSVDTWWESQMGPRSGEHVPPAEEAGPR